MKARHRLSHLCGPQNQFAYFVMNREKRIVDRGLWQGATWYPLIKQTWTRLQRSITTLLRPLCPTSRNSTSDSLPAPLRPLLLFTTYFSFSFFATWRWLNSHSVLSTNEHDGHCYQPASRITREFGHHMFSMRNILAVYAASNYAKWTHGICKLNDGDIDIELCLLGIDDVTVMRINIVQICSLNNTKPNSTQEVPKVTVLERSMILTRHRLTVNIRTFWRITMHHFEHKVAERNAHTSKENVNVFISTN
jgi:hypothetical protein